MKINEGFNIIGDMVFQIENESKKIYVVCQKPLRSENLKDIKEMLFSLITYIDIS